MYIQVGTILKSMKNVRSLKQHKENKKIKMYIEHINAILQVLNLTVKGLEHFEVYIPVHRILKTCREEKRILESHLNKYKELLKNE